MIHRTIIFNIILVLVVFQGLSETEKNFSKIHPSLLNVLINTPQNNLVDVYAMLNDRYPLESIIQQTHHLPKKEKQREIVRILKEYAAEKQHAVLTFLRAQENVSRIDILWATNTIVVSATPGVIYLLDGFDEINEIRFDQKFDMNGSDDLQHNPTPLPEGEEINKGITLMRADEVWAEGYFGQGVFAASIDEGCYWEHPDLLNNLWQNLDEDADGDGHTIEEVNGSWELDPGDLNGIDDDNNNYIDDLIGWDFEGNDNQVRGENHGTATAGILVGDGTLGTKTGVAPQAKIVNLKIGRDSEQQQTWCWLAMQYAIDLGVDLITHSQSFYWDGWGGGTDPPDVAMFRDMAVLELAAGIIHFTSISNNGNTIGVPFNISVPGNCPPPWLHPDQTLIGGLSSIMGIGNVKANTDVIHSTSPYGPSSQENYRESLGSSYNIYPIMPEEYQDYPYGNGSMGLLKPDVSAPGGDTESLERFSNGTYGYDGFSGTSSATPHAAGVAALLLSVDPNLTPADISRILQETSVDKGASGHDNRYGAGRVDAYDAYLEVISGLPVELSSFTAVIKDHKVILEWRTETEINNFGFEIERKTTKQISWNRVGFVEGNGNSNSPIDYLFRDENTNEAGIFWYRLKQIDTDGSYEYSDEISVTVIFPSNFLLSQNYPNPFNPVTNISFSLPEDSRVRITVYNLLGEQVAELVNSEYTSGRHVIQFDASGYTSGIYLYKFESIDYLSIRKMIIMR